MAETGELGLSGSQQAFSLSGRLGLPAGDLGAQPGCSNEQSLAFPGGFAVRLLHSLNSWATCRLGGWPGSSGQRDSLRCLPSNSNATNQAPKMSLLTHPGEIDKKNEAQKGVSFKATQSGQTGI